jgi:hypothetical protein
MDEILQELGPALSLIRAALIELQTKLLDIESRQERRAVRRPEDRPDQISRVLN